MQLTLNTNGAVVASASHKVIPSQPPLPYTLAVLVLGQTRRAAEDLAIRADLVAVILHLHLRTTTTSQRTGREDTDRARAAAGAAKLLVPRHAASAIPAAVGLAVVVSGRAAAGAEGGRAGPEAGCGGGEGDFVVALAGEIDVYVCWGIIGVSVCGVLGL